MRERLQCAFRRYYHSRCVAPARAWVAAGCPPAFRPSVPFWQPLAAIVWRLL
jgi:hypothetical protein